MAQGIKASVGRAHDDGSIVMDLSGTAYGFAEGVDYCKVQGAELGLSHYACRSTNLNKVGYIVRAEALLDRLSVSVACDVQMLAERKDRVCLHSDWLDFLGNFGLSSSFDSFSSCAGWPARIGQ